MRILMCIPARAGSKRLPQKNLCEVGGVPLVRRAVDCANEAAAKLIKAGHRADIVVSCGGQDEASITAIEQACPRSTIFQRRPDWLCDGAAVTSYPHGMAAPLWLLEHPSAQYCYPEGPAGTIMPLSNALNNCVEYDAVVLLQPTSPLRKANTVSRCVRTFIRTGRYHSAISCCTAGVPNGAVYVANPKRLLHGKTWGYSTANWVVMSQDESVDVDCQTDLDYANTLHRKQ